MHTVQVHNIKTQVLATVKKEKEKIVYKINLDTVLYR